MKTAKDFVKKHNKPAGTNVTRLPAGTEDSTFKSFFDGFYAHVKEDYGTMGATTTESQDMSGIAAAQAKAKQLMFDTIGPID